MNNINYTSIEQSKHLLELGLSPESADMHFFQYPHDTKEHVYIGYDAHEASSQITMGRYEYIPCWSIGALLELIPKYHIRAPYPGDSDYVCWSTHSDLIDMEFFGKTAIKAAYNMVVWLLENNYIEKGE